MVYCILLYCILLYRTVLHGINVQMRLGLVMFGYHLIVATDSPPLQSPIYTPISPKPFANPKPETLYSWETPRAPNTPFLGNTP